MLIPALEGSNKKPKKGHDKSAVAIIEPPESVTISWKGTKVLGPVRRVRFTRSTLRQANIREKVRRLVKYKSFLIGEGLYVKFEDRSPEETARQERCVRGAWELATKINELKKEEVQDLATQWIQAYPCKAKTSQETERSLQKFLEPDENPKVIYTDNSMEFGKACEDLSWNHCTSTPHRSETNGIAERAVRRVKEGTSAVVLQSGLDESWSADSMECYTYLRNVTDLLSDEKTPYERRFGKPFFGPVIPSGATVDVTLFLLKTYRDYINLVQKSFHENSLDMCCPRRESGKET